MERKRVYCCEPTGQKGKFLPVPLDRLFPKPPKGDKVDTQHDLKIDEKKGSGTSGSASGHAFGFYVMASPNEIQQSLKREDKSNWLVYDCHDAVSEEAQTVKMIVSDSIGLSMFHIGNLFDSVYRSFRQKHLYQYPSR
jgi:chitinase